MKNHGCEQKDGAWLWRFLDIRGDSLVEVLSEYVEANHVLSDPTARENLLLTVGDIVQLKRLGPLGDIWSRLKGKDIRVNAIVWADKEDFPPGFLNDSQSYTLWIQYQNSERRPSPEHFSPVWVQVSNTWVPYYSLWRVDEKRRKVRRRAKNLRVDKRSAARPH